MEIEVTKHILGSNVSADLDLRAIDVNVSFADDTVDIEEGMIFQLICRSPTQ